MAEPLAIGVITGLHPDPRAALDAVRELGIPSVHLSYPAELNSAEGISQIEQALDATGIEITTVFCGFPGESYADIPTVHDTVGLVPAATRDERLKLISTISEFAARLEVERIGAHIGFIPEDPNDELYPLIVQVVQRVCDDLAAREQVFALETGQETAATLRRFINDVARPNLSVNFDPANMILYGNDKPIEALDVLGQWIGSVHCKDGKWPTAPNQLGHETPLGEGDVDIAAWLQKLLQIGYRGPLTIEREISGPQQRQDILKAKQLLEELVAKHSGT